MKFILLVIVLSLSACSQYRSNFSCSPGVGVKCVSTGKILDMIEDGSLEEFRNRANKIKKPQRLSSSSRLAELPKNIQVKKIGVLKEQDVWVAPFIDNQGRERQGRIVKILVPKG